MAPVDNVEAELREQLARLHDRVHRHCLAMLRNVDNADDVAQEALLKAWNRRDTYRRDSPLEHWVMRIATNACLDWMSRQKSRPTVTLDETVSQHVGTNDAQITRVENQVLLNQLLPALRECMGEQNYWIWQQKTIGLTEEEIARTLPAHWQLSKDGVHSRVQRKIKSCLDTLRRKHRG